MSSRLPARRRRRSGPKPRKAPHGCCSRLRTRRRGSVSRRSSTPHFGAQEAAVEAEAALETARLRVATWWPRPGSTASGCWPIWPSDASTPVNSCSSCGGGRERLVQRIRAGPAGGRGRCSASSMRWEATPRSCVGALSAPTIGPAPISASRAVGGTPPRCHGGQPATPAEVAEPVVNVGAGRRARRSRNRRPGDLRQSSPSPTAPTSSDGSDADSSVGADRRFAEPALRSRRRSRPVVALFAGELDTGPAGAGTSMIRSAPRHRSTTCSPGCGPPSRRDGERRDPCSGDARRSSIGRCRDHRAGARHCLDPDTDSRSGLDPGERRVRRLDSWPTPRSSAATRRSPRSSSTWPESSSGRWPTSRTTCSMCCGARSRCDRSNSSCRRPRRTWRRIVERRPRGVARRRPRPGPDRCRATTLPGSIGGWPMPPSSPEPSSRSWTPRSSSRCVSVAPAGGRTGRRQQRVDRHRGALDLPRVEDPAARRARRRARPQSPTPRAPTPPSVPGTPVRWVAIRELVAATMPPSNEAAGVVRAGDVFPSGDVCPPTDLGVPLPAGDRRPGSVGRGEGPVRSAAPLRRGGSRVVSATGAVWSSSCCSSSSSCSSSRPGAWPGFYVEVALVPLRRPLRRVLGGAAHQGACSRRCSPPGSSQSPWPARSSPIAWPRRSDPTGPRSSCSSDTARLVGHRQGRLRVRCRRRVRVVAGLPASAHWQEWTLFRNAVSFGIDR